LTRRGVLASPLLAIAILVACGAVALAVTRGTGPRHPRVAHAQAAAVSGVLTTSNSRDGAAILGAGAMRPGTSVSGSVTIANTGDLAGAFRLAAGDASDQPGQGGGRLSDRLLLQIFDVTAPATPVPVWSGPLSALTDLDLGSFAGAQARTYRLTASFPDAGPGADNAYAGASTSVRLVWTATADAPAPAPPGPPPAPPGATPSSAPQTTSITAAGAIVTLTVPGGCVRPGSVFRAKLGWKRQKRKGAVFVKVRRTDFYVGSRRVLLDRRPPFVARMSVPLSAVPGSTLTVRARAFIKVRRGHSPTKSIRATLRICS
jgi:spore coat-associated protein N